MSDLARDRVYDQTTDPAVAFLAAATGVVRLEIAGDRVGRFGLDRRCDARDVAAGPGRVVVATDGDVLVRPAEPGPARTMDDDPYRETGFGPAVAVAVDDGTPVAAGPDGEIGRLVDEEWLTIADVDAQVRALDGGLVAAGDGVYLATPDGLDHVGLDDARDVAAAGPYAATGDGLYALGNGWIREREGAVDVVAATRAGHGLERAHAAAGPDLLERRDVEWTGVELPTRDPVAGVAHGPGTYAVTDSGTVLARDGGGGTEAGDGGGADREWGTRSIGVGDVREIAVPGTNG